MIFNGGRFLDIVKALTLNVFVQHWEDAGINPPPPGHDVRITNTFDTRITNGNDIRITNTS